MSEELSKLPLDLVPSLQAALAEGGLKPEQLTVALPMIGEKKPVIENRQAIVIDDGARTTLWTAPSLRELFRGNAVPPKMEEYPKEYIPCFSYFEQHFLTVCEALGDRTDQEMEEVYALLRRRPDGKSLGVMHDFMWQVSALMLATRAISGAEFEAIVGRLERSARNWALRPISRNYAAAVRKMFDQLR